MCCPVKVHALLLSTSLWQLKISHSGRIYTVEIGRHLQSFYSEEPLFNISLVQSHELTIQGSGICHGPKLGTPWVFRHSRRINALWHIFSCTRTSQPGEQTHTITYGKMDESHRHRTINLWGYLLCKFQNQAKFSCVRGYDSGRGCARHVWKGAPMGHWGGGRKYSAPTSELWLLGSVYLVKKLIELTWFYMFLQA